MFFLNEWTYLLLYLVVMPVWIFILYLLTGYRNPKNKKVQNTIS